MIDEGLLYYQKRLADAGKVKYNISESIDIYNVNLHNPFQILTLSNVSFVYEAWQHVAILNAEVVIGTKHIGGDHRGKVTAILLEVGSVKQAAFMLTALFFTPPGHETFM